jgi:hypothetical protein
MAVSKLRATSRGPWRSAIAGAILASAAAACDTGGTSSPTAAPPVAAPTAAPATAGASPPPPSSRAEIDLAGIIVSPAESPLGMHHDETVAGPPTLTLVIVSGSDERFANMDGFRDGLATTFSGSQGALLSLVLAFEPSLAGDIAYHEYARELRSETGYGLEGGRVEGLGFESICGTGTNPALDGLVESICLWRDAGLVLALGGPVPLADVKRLAEEMDTRAALAIAEP